jgi:trans-aconitate methyltransferase
MAAETIAAANAKRATTGRPHTESVNTWDADQYDATFGFVSRLGEGLVAELAPAPGERILDVGCGTGQLTAHIAAAGALVVGLDADAHMLRRAASSHPGLTWLAVDAQRLSPADTPLAPFDAAFSNAALHWMTDQAAALAGIRSVLRADARFVAEMGGAGNIAAVDAALRGALADCRLDIEVPRNHFPAVAHQAALLEGAGFRVESIRWFPRPTPLGVGTTLVDWAGHFRADVWRTVAPRDRPEVARRLLDRGAAAGLLRNGTWYADYCRLRFRAVAV